MTTTTILLVRHAEHELLGKVLAGRMPGVRLSAIGRRHANLLGARLAGTGIVAVQASPRERAQETAAAIAAALGVHCDTAEALDEIDFGGWTGKTFADLMADPLWRAWNVARATARPPGGESMAEVQARMVGHLRQLSVAHPGGRLVLVGHADPIKAALLWVLGAGLDAYDRLDLDPAGVSTVALGPWGARILGLNERMAA